MPTTQRNKTNASNEYSSVWWRAKITVYRPLLVHHDKTNCAAWCGGQAFELLSTGRFQNLCNLNIHQKKQTGWNFVLAKISASDGILFWSKVINLRLTCIRIFKAPAPQFRWMDSTYLLEFTDLWCKGFLQKCYTKKLWLCTWVLKERYFIL